jgi:hypothetical protein
MILSLNLAWFLINQIVLIKLMIAAINVTLLWGAQFKSQSFHISSKEVNCKVIFKQPANQDHNLIANLQSKKRWKDDSSCQLHKLHIDGTKQPLYFKFSSVGTLSFINTKRDLEGGISAHQIILAQCNSCQVWELNKWVKIQMSQNKKIKTAFKPNFILTSFCFLVNRVGKILYLRKILILIIFINNS